MTGPSDLVSVFLTRLAKGYIGTLGPVSSTVATKLAAEILHAAREERSGISIAELLQSLRQKAAIGIQGRNVSDENWERFLFTFMFVYFGNPMTYLRLTPSESQNDRR